MNHKSLLALFSLSAAFCCLCEIFLSFYTVEATTGFFLSGMKPIGLLLCLGVAVCVLAPAVFSLLNRDVRRPREFASPACCGVSVLLGIAVIWESVKVRTFSIPSWQPAALKIFGVAAGLFFVTWAVAGLTHRKINGIFYCLPILYFVFRIIVAFSSYASLATIVSHVLYLAESCLTLLYWLSCAKFHLGLQGEKQFGWMRAFGFAFSVLSLSSAVLALVYRFTGRVSLSHQNTDFLWTGLLCVFFFLLDYSSTREKKNFPEEENLSETEMKN